MSTSLVDIQVRQREFLLAISRALTAELDLSDVLRIILQASVEFISGHAGLVVLADPADQRFRVAAALGIHKEAIESQQALVDGVPYETGQEQQSLPAIGQEIQALSRLISINHDVAQTLHLPMQSGDTLIGVVYVFQHKNYVFSDDAPKLLQSFADQAAIAVKNARLYEQVISEKQRLNAILQQSADGVMILDSDLNIEVFNKALSHITGFRVSEVLNYHHDDIMAIENLRTSGNLHDAIAEGWPQPGSPPLYVEGDIKKSNGDMVSIGTTYAPLLNARGRVINIIANIRDLTRYRQEEQLQKTFISVVSHELKTPVSIIKGYAGTLKRKDAKWSREVLEEYLTVIEDEADQLTDLIDNLLEASRLQAGTFTLNAHDGLCLKTMAYRAAKKFRIQTEIHTFELDFPDRYPEITADERRLTQVFNNLISNAIKYAPNGGVIKIGGTIHEDYVNISIADPGIGIPSHESHRIFQKFSRLDNDLSRKTEGTGLGLFLTKAIIDAHNGRIWFHGQTDPQIGPTGTTFTFSLPR